MPIPTVMGMSVYSFVAAVFSAIGALFTIINGTRKLVPTKRYLVAMASFLKVVKTWKALDRDSRVLLPRQRAGFIAIIQSLDKDVRSLFFIGKPGYNVIVLVRSVFKSRKVTKLANDVNKLRVALLWLSTQSAHIAKMQKKMDEDGVFVNLTPVETRFRKMADLLIKSFGARAPDFHSDVEETDDKSEVTQVIGASGLNLRPLADDPSLDTVLPVPGRTVPPLGRPYPVPVRR